MRRLLVASLRRRQPSDAPACRCGTLSIDTYPGPGGGLLPSRTRLLLLALSLIRYAPAACYSTTYRQHVRHMSYKVTHLTFHECLRICTMMHPRPPHVRARAMHHVRDHSSSKSSPAVTRFAESISNHQLTNAHVLVAHARAHALRSDGVPDSNAEEAL